LEQFVFLFDDLGLNDFLLRHAIHCENVEITCLTFISLACFALHLYCFVSLFLVTVSGLQTITTRVPEEMFQDIKKIEREEKTERAEVVRKLLVEAIKRWKLKKALEALHEGKMTFRSAAKLAGLTYVEMLDETERAGIPVGYTVSDLQLDLEAVKKKEK